MLYWNRFNLSLPGRIKMSNTFLLSLINHLGCFIMPQEDQIDKMQKIIDNFCVGTLNCAKGRLYTFPKKGLNSSLLPSTHFGLKDVVPLLGITGG